MPSAPRWSASPSLLRVSALTGDHRFRKEVMMPERIQLRRTKGWRMPPNTVSVARPTDYGNPFRVGIHGTAEECVAKYRERLLMHLNAILTRQLLRDIRGKNLACWCKPDQPCHADVLLELANAQTSPPRDGSAEPKRALDK